ncbi:MAG: SUMF1/EgtB/PvdO family nonheme iron enzyme [Polyangiaceae bacterium]|nr:SUMF1/EgtB/PvdO family nonheme iron enzyme [Polyangiaceae bacterium]
MTERDPLNITGQLIADKYQVEQLVGEGGFAVVYRAMHVIWKKPVAIKFFNGLSSAPQDQRESLTQDFINEGALLTELSSQTANIVQARDVGTYTAPDGAWMPYMVLEWLEGRPLDAIMDADRAAGLPPWTIQQVYRVLEPAATALDLAHSRGIAHRDIKPANLFISGDPRSGAAGVKVLDFGVAKMMSDNTHMQAALAKTGTAITSFTPQYGAPEQFSRSHGATGPWTDVYALALVGVELLTGKVALDGGDFIQLAFSSANPERRPTPRTLGAEVSDAVEAVFARALATAPSERYPSCGQFISALAVSLGITGPVSMMPVQNDLTFGATVMAGPTSIPTPVSFPGNVQPSYSAATTASPSTVDPAGVAAQRKGSGGLLFAGIGGLAVLLIGGGAYFALNNDKGGAGPSASTEASSAPVASAAEPVPFTCPEGTVKIEKGQFFMGSDHPDARPNQKPVHNVTLNSYCMDLYQVTVKDYKACSDSGKCRRAPTEVSWPAMTEKQKQTYSPLCNINDPEGRADHPINCVTWDMANVYCKAQGKRLPTEAEWEYATRGPDGRVYPWGDEEPTEKHLNACGTECVKWGEENGEELSALYEADDGYPTTSPVGKFPAGRSRFGPYDVVGNVWEWVADYEGTYTPDARVDPRGPEVGEKRVLRGGAFNGGFREWLWPSYRYASLPKTQSYGHGFRCAMDFEGDDDAAPQ